MEIFKRTTLYHCIALSFLCHLILTGGVWLVPTHKQQQPVTIDVISSRDTPKIKRQIVEQPKKSINNISPKKTRFLGRHNQKILKQTQAKSHGAFKNTSLPINSPIKKTRRESKWTRFSPKYKFSYTKKNNSTLKPSQTNDALKDIAKGTHTLLNTREFIYYSYYSRIRKQLRQRWEKNIRKKLSEIYKSGRAIATTHNHATKILVVLNTKGDLLNIKVLGHSGVKDLDAAAIEAFRSAAPFPNPPKGIVNSKGQIQIPWEFVIET